MTDNLQAYNFLIKPLRDADARDGLLFLNRYLGGPQERWDATRARIEELWKLWSVLDCPDELLVYLKRIVGWTPDLDNITGRLTPDLLRRLIAVSAILWRDRGPEDTLLDVLRLLTGMRCRIWNWFDTRFLLGETQLGEDAEGSDPFLIDSPGSGTAEFQSNLRIVDQGSLDRTLVEDIVRLMRPVGERIDVSYLAFLDLFDTDGDSTQWTQTLGHSMRVTGGRLTLTSAATEIVIASTPNASSWSNAMTSARILGSTDAVVGLVFHYQDLNNYRTLTLSPTANLIVIQYIVGGVVTPIYTDLDLLGITIREGTHYMLRVCSTSLGTGSDRVQGYIDGNLAIAADVPDHKSGPSGLWHRATFSLEATEFEVATLPMDTVEVGIT